METRGPDFPPQLRDPIVKRAQKLRSRIADGRTWRAARFDSRFGSFRELGRAPINAGLHDEEVLPDFFFPLSQTLADIKRERPRTEDRVRGQHDDSFGIMPDRFDQARARRRGNKPGSNRVMIRTASRTLRHLAIERVEAELQGIASGFRPELLALLIQRRHPVILSAITRLFGHP